MGFVVLVHLALCNLEFVLRSFLFRLEAFDFYFELLLDPLLLGAAFCQLPDLFLEFPVLLNHRLLEEVGTRYLPLFFL